MNSETKDEVVQLYLDDIIPNRFQPREIFDEKALKELAVSIKEHGVIQPIIVRNVNGKYEIIAGERRYKASALAGLTRIPAIIRNLDDKESSKVALLENLQRKNLNPIEEARTYQKILEIDEMTQEELAKTMGKSQSSVANKLRLLSLQDEVQEALLKEQISERHARALLNVNDNKKQSELLKQVINNKMTVRALEEEISKLSSNDIEEPINPNSAEEPTGTQFTQIPSVSSIVNSTPLTPTAKMPDNQSDYGKVTIAPPIIGKDNINNPDEFINYGEIDKDKLNQQNNSNTRTDYYTTTMVTPIDIQSMQEKATDIQPETNEPVAALDSLLNITTSVKPTSLQSKQSTEDQAQVPAIDRTIKSNFQTSTESNERDYFKASDLSNIEFSPATQPTINDDTSSIASATITQNSVLSIPTAPMDHTDSSQNAISKIKNLINELENQGVKISMDEMDFGKSYQVIIKIDK